MRRLRAGRELHGMTTVAENLAEVVADALDRCVPGSIGFQNLTGCHRDRLLSRATAVINAIHEAGYVISLREQALNDSEQSRIGATGNQTTMGTREAFSSR